MRRYLLLSFAIAVAVILSFFAVNAAEIPFLQDPSEWMEHGWWIAAVAGFSLLLADVLIPVPSSVVMIAHGALLGLFPGFAVSLIGNVGGAALGWWIGRRSAPWVNRMVGSADQRRASEWIARHGMGAVVISRSIPVLNETIAVMAGVTRLSLHRMLLASMLGSIPPSLIYAWAGSQAVEGNLGLWIAGFVFILAGAAWFLSFRMKQNKSVSG
jgi:uncharacterized membrane protein YdjX (TVP38/TMEM64 family)